MNKNNINIHYLYNSLLTLNQFICDMARIINAFKILSKGVGKWYVLVSDEFVRHNIHPIVKKKYVRVLLEQQNSRYPAKKSF